jgi:alkylation response protein AidB-like acyl-CoA dehydrogenase
MFITNARHGTMLAVAAKTDTKAKPAYAGISMFAIEKNERGPTVSRNIKKLGYKGIDTCEVLFEELEVPANNLIGGQEGQGFKQVMSALEVGRINVAARAVGVAQAAFESAIRYAQQRTTFGKPICEHQAVQLILADMGTRLEAARLMVQSAAEKKDAGERCDVEAGMAKLFASEACVKMSLDAMRVLGGYGYTAEFPVERFYRDAPLMMIGEGTNEIQALVIARGLLSRNRI